MLSKSRAGSRGFTLIELVLVLAIGGLILSIIFAGVAGAQRSRRDTARKAAAVRFLSSVALAMTDTQGQVPANCAALAGYYVVPDFPCKDSLAPSDDPSKNILYSGPAQTCDSSANFTAGDSYVVSAGITLEQGGKYCLDNTGKSVTSASGGGGGGGGDTTPPTITLDAPAANSTVGGTTAIRTTPADNVGVSKVEFRIDGSLVYTATSSPYTYNWNTATHANGTATIQVQAFDTSNNSSLTAPQIQVTVYNGPVDNAAPTVSISDPVNGETISGTKVVQISASDDVGVTQVDLKIDGNVVQSWTTSPYSYNWATTLLVNGPHTLTAVANDAAGHSTTSAAVSVTVSNADTQGPLVSWAQPAPSVTSCKIGTITLSITADDNSGTVSRYEIWIDGVKKADSYTYSWTPSSAKTYTLEGKAYDPSNNVSTNGSRSLQIKSNGASC